MKRIGSAIRSLRNRLARRKSGYSYEGALTQYAGKNGRFSVAPPADASGLPLRVELPARLNFDQSAVIWLIGFLLAGLVYLVVRGAELNAILLMAGIPLFLSLFLAWQWLTLGRDDRLVEFRKDGVAEIDPLSPSADVRFTPYEEFEGVVKYTHIVTHVWKGIVSKQPYLVVELRHVDERRTVPLFIKIYPEDESKATRIGRAFSDLLGVPILDGRG